jgi:hypothetical protein
MIYNLCYILIAKDFETYLIDVLWCCAVNHILKVNNRNANSI